MLQPTIDLLRQEAVDLGFVGFGICDAIDSEGFSKLVHWINEGYAAGMHYFANRLAAYKHPSGVLPGCRSIVCLAYPYPSSELQPNQVGIGKVARYAWPGTDYHDVIHPKLKILCKKLEQNIPNSCSRGVVDTAPIMEREIAQLSGIGWRGKNTLLLNKNYGSYFFLSCILTDVHLPPDSPHVASHCGTCTACLEACPTDAFPQPGVLDANRCISYLTIEHNEMIAGDLQPGLGDWVFGCDICQEVCPWNEKQQRKEARLSKKNFQEHASHHGSSDEHPLRTLSLPNLFWLSDEEFRNLYRKTPLWRTRRRGMLRNAAIVLTNQLLRQRTKKDSEGDNRNDPATINEIVSAINHGTHDADELVRDACVEAIERLNSIN